MQTIKAITTRVMDYYELASFVAGWVAYHPVSQVVLRWLRQ